MTVLLNYIGHCKFSNPTPCR